MKKNSMLSLILAVPAFILCLAVRFLQLAGGTDMETGFLNNENGFLINFGFYGLLIITFGAAVALNILDKKKTGAFFENEISGFVDAKAVMLGFPLIIAGALAAYEGYMQMNTLTPSGFLIFVDLLFGVAILVQGFVILYKKEITPALGFSLVIPAIYYTLRGISIFLDRMVVASVPEYLIECLHIIGAAVFFMMLAKLLSGNEGKNTRLALCAVGITTSVMTLSSSIATILADIIDPYGVSERIVSTADEAERAAQALYSKNLNGYHMAYTPWVDVVIAACIILTLAALYIKNKPVASKEEAPAEAGIQSSETEE